MELSLSKIVTKEYVTVERYGYSVYENHPLASINDGKLQLGSYPIDDYTEDEYQGKVPSLYCVREGGNKEGRYWSFVCGLDLMKNGRVWVGCGSGNKEFDTIESAILHVAETQKLQIEDIKIFTEEAFPLQGLTENN